MPSADQFISGVASKARRPSPLPVYAVVGEEDFLRRDALAAVLELLSTDDEPDITRLDGDSSDIAGLLDELRARTLFGGRRVIVLTDMGGRRPFIDTHRDKLAEYAAAPSDDAHLVLVTPKLNKSIKLNKAIDKAGGRIECEPLKHEALARWLAKRAKKQKLGMSHDVAEFFIACAGDRMGVLAMELEKLDLYLGGEGEREVTVPILEDVLGFRGSTTTWDLLDEIVGGDLPAALRDTNTLISQGDSPYALIGLVAWKLRQYWRAAGALADGASQRDAAVAAGVKAPFLQKRFLASLKGFDLATCRAIHDALIEVDRKANPVEPDRAFEFFVIRVCQRLTRAR